MDETGTRRPGWSDLVRRHIHDTVGYVLRLGDAALCRDFQEKETGSRVPGRAYRSLQADDLADFRPQASWLLGVLLCDGDDLGPLVAWARRRDPADLDRLRFYHPPDADLRTVMAPWVDAALPPPLAFPVATWEAFHRMFGYHHAIHVYADFAPANPDV